MNSTGITWFWPLSFLAALGQLLLIVTDNPGGPAPARFLLAVWTLWLPGVALGNLLTKPGTRLLSQLPIQASCALGVAFLILLARAAGMPAAMAPIAATALSLLVASAFLFVPAERRGRRKKSWELQDLPTEQALAGTALWVIVIGLFLLHLFLGSPLSLRADAADHVAAARRSGTMGELFPAYPAHEAAGTLAYDAESGLVPALLDAVSRLSSLPHDRVWDLAPCVLAPLLFMAWYAFGLAVFHSQGAALAAALAQWLFATQGFTDPVLRSSTAPAVLAQIPFWTAAAIAVEGLERPHLPIMLAFAPVGLAVWGSHFAFGLLLVVFLLVLGARSITSIDRVQEEVPFLVALWIPWLLLTAVYFTVRANAAGGLMPAFAPAGGLLVLAPGTWILDVADAAPFVVLGTAAAYLFLIALLEDAAKSVARYALIALMVAAPLLALNPLLTPILERAVGSAVLYLPLLAPIGVVLTAEALWAGGGLLRSEPHAWARVVVLAASVVVLGAAVVSPRGSFAYTPARVRAGNAAPPEDRRALALAVADTLTRDTRVLTDPVTASALAAYGGLPSVYVPRDPRDRGEARRRLHAFLALARPDALRSAAPDTTRADTVAGLPGDAVPRPASVVRAPALRADAVLLVDAVGTDASPRFAAALAGFHRWTRASVSDTLRFRPVPLVEVSGALWHGAVRPAETDEPAPSWPSDRPSASLGVLAPRLLDLRLEREGIVVGEPFTVTTSWRWDEHLPAAGMDPRGYRVRVEVQRHENADGGFLSGPRRALARLADLVAGRSTGWAHEVPLAEGMPPSWWEDDLHVQPIVMALPEDLPSGVYEVRARALPRPYARDAYRSGLTFLPAEGPVAEVRVGGGR